jgi:hypothetical protein
MTVGSGYRDVVTAAWLAANPQGTGGVDVEAGSVISP